MLSLLSLMINAVHLVFARKSRNPSPLFPGRPRWYDKKCDKARKEMYQAVRAFRKKRCDSSLSNFLKSKTEYRKVRNDAKLKECSRVQNEVEVAIKEKDSRTFWNTVKRFTKPRQVSASLSPSTWLDNFESSMNSQVPVRPEWENRQDTSQISSLDAPISSLSLIHI